jgi:hypothetical protein
MISCFGRSETAQKCTRSEADHVLKPFALEARWKNIVYKPTASEGTPAYCHHDWLRIISRNC